MGFTLLELLVVVAILSILMSILMSTLSKVHRTATSVICQTKLRSVAQRFTFFADDYWPTDRGDSEELGQNLFRIGDFLESQYMIDEFWDVDPSPSPVAGYERSRMPLMCPAGPSTLMRTPSKPMGEGAITPIENVSTGFNMHLFQDNAEVDGGWVTAEMILTPEVLEYPLVPLVFDVDGLEAQRRNKSPFYATPWLGDQGPLTGDSYWFPSRRHDGRVQAAFIGGHVASSLSPSTEPAWDWGYRPTLVQVDQPGLDD